MSNAQIEHFLAFFAKGTKRKSSKKHEQGKLEEIEVTKKVCNSN
jgi:hypothetical protein